MIPLRTGPARSARSRFFFALVAWGVTLSSSAWAAPCGRPDFLESFPPDGATDVPTNARLAAHYAATAEYLGEEVTLEHVGGATEIPRATFDPTEGLLSFEPPAPLIAGDVYVIRWPSLRGLTTAAAGKGAEVKFTAGSIVDADAPLFAGVRAVSWDVERVDDECTDALEDRFAFDLSIDEPRDDGGRSMLTLLVFQSKGGSASTSPSPVLVQRVTEARSPVRVQRAIDSAAGHVCFAALVRDALGRISNSADHEVCVTTVRPPFFYGCAVSRGAITGNAGGRGTVCLALLVSAAFVRRRARRKTPHV